MPRHHSRFHRGGRSRAVAKIHMNAKGKSICAGCGNGIADGEAIIRLYLKPAYRMPCSQCGAVGKDAKRYHPQCCPSDINAAMGYNPAARPAAKGNAVPPPPKPTSANDLTLAAVASLEAALIAQVRERKRAMTPELESEFKKFQGIKQRILRPGTPGEEQAAMVVGLQRLVKMVF